LIVKIQDNDINKKWRNNYKYSIDISLRKIFYKFLLCELPANKYKLSCYDEFINLCKKVNHLSIMKVGVRRGDRAEKLIRKISRCREYVGFDLFEDIDNRTFVLEHMWKCFPANFGEVKTRLKSIKSNVKVNLI